ncbi:hypothetical protein J43TS9_07690 [Paenibacillus cineris]|nr:hypothetical protein J43TS9_07690 [Paenibacillus cineris]
MNPYVIEQKTYQIHPRIMPLDPWTTGEVSETMGETVSNQPGEVEKDETQIDQGVVGHGGNGHIGRAGGAYRFRRL